MMRTVAIAVFLVVASGAKVGSLEPQRLNTIAKELEEQPNLWNSAKAYANAGYASLLQLGSPEEVAKKDKTLQTVPASYENEQELVDAVRAARRAVLIGALMGFLKVLLMIGSVAGFSVMYERHIAQKPLILEEVSEEIKGQDFKTGLFSCFSDPKTCASSCCCFIFRWADTMQAAGILGFWLGIFVALFGLNIYFQWHSTVGTMGSCIIMGVFFAYYRSQLRKNLGMRYTGDDQVKDVIAWTFCCPCAAAQEAQQVKLAGKSQEV